MDNPLTPKKIQRLMHFAEDKSFSEPKRLLLEKNFNGAQPSKLAQTNCESSSGILDLDQLDAFGESELGNKVPISDMSVNKSTVFNPGEMTGRSTDNIEAPSEILPTFVCAIVDSITSQANKQTSEINDIMSQSIASNYSFHSKRDLTADEVSLIMREAPLPVPLNQLTQTRFAESIVSTTSEISVGSYFRNRCPEFGKMLGRTESPGKPSISDVTSSRIEYALTNYDVYKPDSYADSVPVAQLCNSADRTDIDRTHLAQKQHDDSVIIIPEHDVPTVSDVVQSNQKNTSRAVNKTTALKPTDILLKNLQSSLRPVNEDTAEGSVDNSISISKIADYLGKESNVSVTDMLKYNKNKSPKRQSLTERQMNVQDKDTQVTYLKDTRNMDTASSSGTVNTVISLEKLKINEIPCISKVPNIVVTSDSVENTDIVCIRSESKKTKSPSSKSNPTLNTVWEDSLSVKLNDSPLQNSKGEIITSHNCSSILYRELDSSIDWREVLRYKHMREEGFIKEPWAQTEVLPAHGFVGVNFAVDLKITVLKDVWLTAKIQFNNLPAQTKDLTIELPRMPMLLSPRNTETFTLHLTSYIELNTALQYTLLLKDSSIDKEIEHNGEFVVDIKMPTVQAVTSDILNRISFPPVQETASLTKCFVLISDCPYDLQLDLSIVEGESMFTMRNVEEVKKSDVNRILTDRQTVTEDVHYKSKLKKQLCRLTGGKAIKVTIVFKAPKLSELQMEDSIVTFNGALNVNLIGVNNTLKKMDLIGVVGTVKLDINVPDNKLQFSNEPTTITVSNTGSIQGAWTLRIIPKSPIEYDVPFKVTPQQLEMCAGESKKIKLVYTGPEDVTHEGILIFKNVGSNKKTIIDITGGTDKPKTFPIKTNYNNISWVRSERKELSLKNSTDKKVRIRCKIKGEGFTVDLPGLDFRVWLVFPFEPYERRALPILFAPTNISPHVACLNLVYDNELSRKIKLHGCTSDACVRWSGLMTYGDTALLRAVSRTPVQLQMCNKANTSAFLCAQLHFNVQYMSLSAETSLLGSRYVMRGRSSHSVTVTPPWVKLEKNPPTSATVFATVSVLTGSELTRRRILKIIKDENNGVLDASFLPDHLKVLVEDFENEDPALDTLLADFQEAKGQLNELISGIRELTAQIHLPQDFNEETTIIITDDTVLEHHTLFD